MRLGRPIVSAAILVVIAVPALAGVAAAGGGSTSRAAQDAARRQATLAYWTPARIRAAKPMDLVADATANGFHFAPTGKPGGGGGGGGKPGGGGSGNTQGASWPNGKGNVYRSVGKVVFHNAGGDWICSGTALTDSRSDASLVLTAGHCVYDMDNGFGSLSGFDTNWMFIPQFDSSPTYTCASTTYGCWTATALVVNGGFAREHGFTTAGSHYDWGFAIVGPGGKGNTQLEATVPTFALAATSMSGNTSVDAFGYPAAGQYHGADLTYCQNPVGFDIYTGNTNYRLGCNMTGGSSGGPWFSGFDGTGNTGTIRSLNSYGYNGITAMYGPIFNSTTAATYNVANNSATTTNTIVN
jgi:V8-like Glu-specific endopeptidase